MGHKVRYTVNDLFSDSARWYADKVAIDLPLKKWTYSELDELINKTAAGFQALGVRKGTRVGISMPNSLHSVVAYLGLLRAGGIAVNFNPKTPTAQLEPRVKDSGIELMVVPNHKLIFVQVLPLLDSTQLKKFIVCPLGQSLSPIKRLGYALKFGTKLDPHDKRFITFDTLTKLGDSNPVFPLVYLADVCDMVYTSGTTGEPKGVEHTHYSIAFNVHQAQDWLEVKLGQERILGFVPSFHVYGKLGPLLSFKTGGTYVPMPIPDFDAMIPILRQQRITVLPGLPRTYKKLNDWMEDHPGKNPVPFVYRAVAGGEPISPSEAEKFTDKTNIRVLNGYGATEGGGFIAGTPVGLRKKHYPYALQPAMLTAIEIKDENGTPLSDGEVGEIYVTGPQVMKDYYNNPQATGEKMPSSNTVRTGDLGRMNLDGTFSLVDRISRLIIVNGNNVHPAEVENALVRHPGVLECAVINSPGSNGQDRVKAIVVPKAGAALSDEDIRAFVKTQLLPYNAPSVVEFRSEPLPRNPVGKVELALLEQADRRLIGPTPMAPKVKRAANPQ
jgi:long-chain acyl-CoA synthetase